MKNKKISNPVQLGYIRRYTLTEGREAGLKVVEMASGSLRVLLNESKALDIMQVWYKGVNVSYVSKNGFIAETLPFGKRFEGGMLYTCGLDAIGDIDGFEPHGTIHSTPSKIIHIAEQQDKLQVTAFVEHTALFDANLLLQRTITLFTKENKLLLEDKLVNNGTKTEDYCLLYHINFGYPILDEGAEIVADLNSVTPRTEHAAKNLQNRAVFSAPIDNEEESCYFLDTASNQISLINKQMGNKVTLAYSKETLPSFIQWNSPASGDYVLGLEPATSYLDHLFEYKQIAPDEEISFYAQLTFDTL